MTQIVCEDVCDNVCNPVRESVRTHVEIETIQEIWDKVLVESMLFTIDTSDIWHDGICMEWVE